MTEAFPGGGSPAPNALEPIDPRKWLTPGWYWADLRQQDLGAWSQFVSSNPAVKPSKSSGHGDGFTWVLFQVTGTSPVVYTVPGLAFKALKGANMSVEDYLSSPASIEQAAGVQNAGEDFTATWKKLMAELGTAGQVVLWGGVALVLWKIYNAGGRPSSSRRQSAYEEREEHHVTVRSPHSGRRRTGSGTLVSYR